MARSEVNYIYDAENAFRAPGQAAITASATVGTLPLDKLVNVRPSSQRNKLGAESYKIVVVVETAAGGDSTYALDVAVGAEGAGDTTVVGSITVGEAGQYVVEVDAHTIEKMDPDHAEMALVATLGGTSPSLTFSAWLV